MLSNKEHNRIKSKDRKHAFDPEKESKIQEKKKENRLSTKRKVRFKKKGKKESF